ncbi:MAG: hypothetical protein AAFX85_03095 [Pseudomonadota bacterium]
MTVEVNTGWQVRLESLALIRVSGEDSKSFLQGQLSNDVERLDGQRRAQLSSFSNARGRVYAVLLVLYFGIDDYGLVLPRAQADDVAQRLTLFVLRSKVSVTPAKDALLTGIAGDSLPASLADKPWATTDLGDDALAVRWPDDGTARALAVYGSAPAAEVCESSDDTRWWRHEVSAGVPWILAPQAREQHVAQMLDLDLLEGISFDKGCYTGQEVIARTHYLGRVKRRLHRLGAEQPIADALGAPIEACSEDGAWQKTGSVVLSAGKEVLAVLQLDHARRPLRLAPQTSAPALDLTVLPLLRKSI